MREADITHCCISDTEGGVSMTGATKHCFFGLMAILLVTSAFVSSVSACDQATDEAGVQTSPAPAHAPSPTFPPEPSPAQTPNSTVASAPPTKAREGAAPTTATSVTLQPTVAVQPPTPTQLPSPSLTATQGNRAEMSRPPQRPTPTLTVMQENRFWAHNTEKILLDNEIHNLLPDVILSGVDARSRSVFYGLVCEKNVDRTWQILQKHLPLLGIPLDAVRVEVVGYIYPAIDPPPPDIFHCVPPEVVDPVTWVSAPGFGGYYVEDGVAYIYLLEPSQELGERLVREELGSVAFERLREVRVLKGQYTWEQLVEWHDLIRSGVEMPDPHPFTLVLVPRNNRITIEIDRDDYDYVTATIEDEISRLGVPREAVIFVNEWE